MEEDDGLTKKYVDEIKRQVDAVGGTALLRWPLSVDAITVTVVHEERRGAFSISSLEMMQNPDDERIAILAKQRINQALDTPPPSEYKPRP